MSYIYYENIKAIVGIDEYCDQERRWHKCRQPKVYKLIRRAALGAQPATGAAAERQPCNTGSLQLLQEAHKLLSMPCTTEDRVVARQKIALYLQQQQAGALSDNKQSVPVCPHARLKWSVYDCTIKNSFALDLMDCNGEGTYSIPGNGGFGYSHQCNKVPDKPAHVG